MNGADRTRERTPSERPSGPGTPGPTRRAGRAGQTNVARRVSCEAMDTDPGPKPLLSSPLGESRGLAMMLPAGSGDRRADPVSMHRHGQGAGSAQIGTFRARTTFHARRHMTGGANPRIGAAPARGEGGGRGVQLRGVELNRVVGSGGVETDASYCRPVIASSSPVPGLRVTTLFVERIARDPFGCI